MLRDNESLQVRTLQPGLDLSFILSFILSRRLASGQLYRQQQIIREHKLRESSRLATRAEQVEQVATLIRFLQKMIDKATGEPDRVTCPRCGWLAGEKAGDGFACFNCRATFRHGDDY
jgi:hypothetical protein